MFSASFLKDEISSLKRKREEAKESLPAKKYVRNEELERKKEEEYMRDMEERRQKKLQVCTLLLVYSVVQKEAEKLEQIKQRLAAEREAENERLPPLPVSEVKKRLALRRTYGTPHHPHC